MRRERIRAKAGGRPGLCPDSVHRMDAGHTLRAHGLRIGELDAGPSNSIADVAGVGVGHVTVVRDEPEPPAGRGIARTGVTAIAPAPPETLFAEPLAAGVAVLNGAGELTGAVQIAEWGMLETPIYLTATMSVGRVLDGAVAAAVAADPAVGVDDVVIPVVGECDDSWLNDARVVQVEAADAGRALEDASAVAQGAVGAGTGTGTGAQGAVGAGTGMVCFGFKGGIGSASRLVPELDAVVGALVLANFGERRELRIDGVPVGRLLGGRGARSRPAGSCIVVLATDAPLLSPALTRVARRAGLGLARTGSVAHHASGEIFLAVSTSCRQPRERRGRTAVATIPDGDLDALFAATVDATEEAVLNALWSAERTEGRDGRVAEALPHDAVLELLAAHRRLPSTA
ncbi:MAG TPA: P1 family peptidase [Solirubrobacteraceae bacterium]